MRTLLVLSGILIGIVFAWACGSLAHRGGDGSSPFLAPDAAAQTGATICTRWEVQSFMPPAFTFTSVPMGKLASGSPDYISLPTYAAFALPEGWEPFAGEGYGAVIARRCVSQ